MMFASKMPSLRMDQSDLKCKNGCDYFGNPQWQGYCSKCHRELMHRQRKAEKAMSTTSTLPRADTKRAEQGPKVTSHSSFSKFEEKRLRQSETLKKANLLKLSMFKKSSNTAREQEQSERKPPEFKIPSMVSEGMKRDFRARFAALTPQVERDARTFVHNFILDVIKCANVMAVDELSERVQRQYQRYMKHMDTAPHYAQIDADTKEALVDFVEKHAMTYLHELPSVVFSPTGTDDERADRAMSERIQQLSWVGEKQLECKLDRASPTCRRLLYKAISELLGMDRAASPGGKLARVRRCCRHVLAVCAPRASADELLPALIFTVLKANPPRLVSNINFVTRFCNAQRLMTGEGGYYFTNLCCAVSFIENLTAESLTMDKKEFDCYMAMPASIGGSSWAAALSLCGETREAHEQRARAQQLLQQARELDARAAALADNAASFQEQIEKKVQDVLSKTPLEIKPRRELPPLGKVKSKGVLIDLTENTPRATQDIVAEELPDSNAENNINEETEQKTAQMLQEVESSHDLPNVFDLDVKDAEAELEPKLNILGFDEIDNPSPTKSSMILDQSWDLKQTNSMELLTPSPLGFTPFDSRSLDELMTPDEFGSDQIAPGLSNINYDIDLSDFSGDNSIADDVPKTEAKDPFSPDGIKKLEPIFDPLAVQPQPINTILDAFDEFSLVDTKRPTESDPFEVVPRRDPFEPISSQSSQPKDPFSPVGSQSLSVDTFAVPKAGPSILDESDSPTAACLLPSPMLPQSSGKQT